MISDVLFEASEDIEYYLKEYPDVYHGMTEELCALCALMRAYHRKLDNPFPVEMSNE